MTPRSGVSTLSNMIRITTLLLVETPYHASHPAGLLPGVMRMADRVLYCKKPVEPARHLACAGSLEFLGDEHVSV